MSSARLAVGDLVELVDTAGRRAIGSVSAVDGWAYVWWWEEEREEAYEPEADEGGAFPEAKGRRRWVKKV